MSGGRFNYIQHQFKNVYEEIQSVLDRQGQKKDKDDLYMRADYYEKYPEELYEYTYPEEIQFWFREAIFILKKAHIMTQRIDWLLSGDDGEETFLKRLKSDFSEIGIDIETMKELPLKELPNENE